VRTPERAGGRPVEAAQAPGGRQPAREDGNSTEQNRHNCEGEQNSYISGGATPAGVDSGGTRTNEGQAEDGGAQAANGSCLSGAAVTVYDHRRGKRPHRYRLVVLTDRSNEAAGAAHGWRFSLSAGAL
jgi:hypothetical protein